MNYANLFEICVLYLDQLLAASSSVYFYRLLGASVNTLISYNDRNFDYLALTKLKDFKFCRLLGTDQINTT